MAKKQKNTVGVIGDITIPTCHRIDFDKVTSIADIKLILESLYIIVYDNHEYFDKFKHLLEDDNDDE